MKLVLFIVVVIICFFAHSISAHGNGIPQCLPALAAYLHGQEASLQIVKNDLQKTKQQLQQAIGKWPPGHYCILAKGPCPAGFFRSSGYMRALKIFAASNTYITPVTFGDSKITCHGPCGKYGQWIGELYITACCK